MTEKKEDALATPATPEMGEFYGGLSLGQLAKTIKLSGCFGDCNQYEAAVKIMAGRDLGLGPVEAMRGLHVFEGKIELGSAVMSSKIKGSGTYDYEVVRHDDEGCFIDCWEKSPRTGTWKQLPSISFTREEATRANLMGKFNWKNYFDDMTFARCLSRFFRRYCPHLAGGAVYGDGEISDSGPQGPPNGRERTNPPDPGQAVEEAPAAPVDPSGDSPTATERPSETWPDGNEGSDPTPATGGATTNSSPPPAASPPTTDTPTPTPAESGSSDPAEHPFSRYCKQVSELKAAILEQDGNDDRYYQVYAARGLENRLSVDKGATKLQREILLELHEALKEAVAEKAAKVAELELLDAIRPDEDDLSQPANASMDPTEEPVTAPSEGTGGTGELFSD